MKVDPMLRSGGLSATGHREGLRKSVHMRAFVPIPQWNSLCAWVLGCYSNFSFKDVGCASQNHRTAKEPARPLGRQHYRGPLRYLPDRSHRATARIGGVLVQAPCEPVGWRLYFQNSPDTRAQCSVLKERLFGFALGVRSRDRQLWVESCTTPHR